MSQNEEPLFPRKIEFADQTVIQALEYEVRQVLEACADVFEQPGIMDAWVSDQSMISDFIPIEVLEMKDEERDRRANKFAQRVSKKLGIVVKIDDYVYEAAIRIRDQ